MMVFGGGILGGARKKRGNPYLNSMTVLFDIFAMNRPGLIHKISVAPGLSDHELILYCSNFY